MESVDEELQAKYQKIAEEYAKIRAQARVLKKAVIDDQKLNSELKEQLKEKDVALRRFEQESDSLTFRNQQLTKRVTVLQEELDYLTNKLKKGRGKTLENKELPPPSPNHVYVEKIQKKILENAQLLAQLYDKDTEIDELNDRIKHLERKIDILENSKIDLETKLHEKIEKLERERSELQRKLSERTKQDETTSWSSVGGKYDYDLKVGVVNHRQVDHSPFSSPSVSRRSSKSIGDGRIQKTPDGHEENNEFESKFEFNRVSDLEKELNQYKSDYNILKIKYDEINQKENYVMEQVDSGALEPIEINNMIGTLKAPFAIPQEIEAREAKIRDYFLREIERLVEEKHICLARNIAATTDNEVMSVHLDNSEEKRAKCEAALLEALSSSQEDEEVREGNYKAQLSIMTEHLANMNEKLIEQTEEIQQLRYELENKNGKRGRQK